MSYFIHVFCGFSVAFLAMMAPGMLNMTALKVSLDAGEKEGRKFAFGAVQIIAIQSGIALFFASYFVIHPTVIEYIEEAAVVIFFILSFYFYKISVKQKGNNVKEVKNNYLFKGALIAALDMLTIPFYITITTYLASKDIIIIEKPFMYLFVFGVFLGALTLLFTYIHYANYISKKSPFITKNMNKILSGLFFVLAITTLVKLF